MESVKSTINHYLGSNENPGQSEHSGHSEQSGQTAQTAQTAQSAQSEHSGQPAQSGESGAPAHDATTHSGEGDHKSHHLHDPLHHKSDASGSDDASAPSHDDKQNSSQGPDPALVGDTNSEKKLTGSGADGSHSAVFGLTPDGHKHEDTTHGTTPLKPAHGGKGKKDKDDKNDKNDDSSRAPTGNSEIKEQMNAPDTEPKGLERKEPAPTGASSDGKPGAGLSGMEQGSGVVGK